MAEATKTKSLIDYVVNSIISNLFHPSSISGITIEQIQNAFDGGEKRIEFTATNRIIGKVTISAEILTDIKPTNLTLDSHGKITIFFIKALIYKIKPPFEVKEVVFTDRFCSCWIAKSKGGELIGRVAHIRDGL